MATLLLADDSVTIHRFVELTFADEDVRVIAVSTGDAAIALMGHTPPDIVLADVGMPGGNGYEVARHIRHTPALAHIPVLLLTGAFDSIDRVLALEVGCQAVLSKPFEPYALVQRVKELLGTARAERNAEAPAVVEAPQTRPQTVARLDDYFEELDRALAARVGEGPPLPADLDPGPAPSGPVPEDDSVTVVEPLLAGAFSALLAAEQAGATPDAFADWLPEEPALVSISEEAIDAIVGRVIERLSDTVVRDAVSAIASATAERLVREEIERIKSNIK